jgi:CRISPR type III-A-associated RAMP protein Csm4
MGGKLLVEQTESKSLPEAVLKGETPVWGIETRPRVTLGRAAQNSSIFFTGRVTYARGCGLWFGIAWREQDLSMKSILRDLLANLGDSGLGAERAVGFGVCKFDPSSTLEMPDAEGQPWISLSRYIPRQDETIALGKGAYRLVSVGGWLDSPVMHGQRRRAVNMIEEGATFGSALRPIPGEVVDVRPSYPTNPNPAGHAVYRSGLALAVGWPGSPAFGAGRGGSK